MSLPELRIIQIEPNADRRWDDFLEAMPDAVVYHHSAWLQVLQEAYGCTVVAFACEDHDGRLCGIFPVTVKRSIWSGLTCASLFGSPAAGPVARNDGALSLLAGAGLDFGTERFHAPLEAKVMSNRLDDILPGLTGVPAETTYVLNLPTDPQLLLLGNAHDRASIRRAIRKSERAGVRVRLAEREAELWNWYGLYLQTMRRLGALPQSYHFFKTAWARLRGMGLLQLLIAERTDGHSTIMIAGLVLLCFGQTIHYAYGGWSWSDQSYRPNDALHWEAIQYAYRKGFTRYDLGGGSMNPGLADYKLKWGAQPQPIYHYRFMSGAKEQRAPNSTVTPNWQINIRSAQSPVRQLALMLLGRLPSSVVASISKWAHRV